MDAGATIVVIGAGPAGLAAADALVARGFQPLVVEAASQVGGIARTVEFAGNRMDVGGHRFFSESTKVLDWWLDILPLAGAPASDDRALGREVPLDASAGAPDPEATDSVMLPRRRLSHIRYSGRLFDYPVRLSGSTLRNLGFGRTLRIGTSYLAARLRPIRPERSLEDFLVNRFGRTLYELFFRDYTEKVWGVPCSRIDPGWGRERIGGVSVSAVIAHAMKSAFGSRETLREQSESSLIGWFLYPKLGPGQLWQTLAERIAANGATIELGCEVTSVRVEGSRVSAVELRERATGARRTVDAPAAVLSSMPLATLASSVRGETPPANVLEVAAGLPFRAFVEVGMLVERLRLTAPGGGPLLDTWIYVQEPHVRLGRVQIFNNWSPYLVADPSKVWLGLEYFCDEGDELWSLSDTEMANIAAEELASIGLVDRDAVIDTTVLRVEKAYPAYFETHGRLGEVRAWVDSIENMFVMGRAGMHRYNNMDDSVLSAWAAVAAALGEGEREAIWSADASAGARGSEL